MPHKTSPNVPTITEKEARRQAARRAFWSEHPLVEAYRRASRTDDVPLRDLIAFVEQMPAPQFNACMLIARPPR